MTRPRANRAARIIKGLASLLMLVVLVGGPPAALYKMTGSPVPHTLPSWHQALATLMRRDDGTLFLATVRYAAWLAWIAFVISVAVEAVCLAAGRPAPQLPVITPAQTFAAALIGAAVLSLLPVPQLRATPPHIGWPSQAVAAAPPRPGQLAPTPSGPAAQHQALPSWALPAAPAAAGPASSVHPAHRHARTHTVVEGDDLWDIATRFLGDGEKWHEIYNLNRTRPQPGGRSLTDPNLIYPGWTLLLPAGSTSPVRHAAPPHGPAGHPPRPAGPATPGHAAAPPTQPAGPEPSPDHHASGHSPASPLHHRPPVHPRTRPVAIHLPSGGFAGITFAAAISAAVAAWRLHRRRVATARWPIPDEPFEPPLPDTIRALRRAHLDSLAADAAEAHGQPWPGDDPESGEDGNEDGLDEFGAPAGLPKTATGGRGEGRPPAGHGQRRHHGEAAPPGSPSVPALLSAPVAPPGQAPPRPMTAPARPEDRQGWRPAPPPAQPLPAGTVAFGARGNSEIPLAAAARGGLGLTGPGAAGVARALLVAILASAQAHGEHPPRVITPGGDARQLITGGQQEPEIAGVDPGLPAGLTVTSGLAGALNELETEITRRLGAADDSAGPDAPTGEYAPMPPLALIAQPDQVSGQRLQAAVQAGASTGVVGIVLGDWPAGTTCRIGPGGTVTAASDPALAGVQAYHLPSGDTAALLSLLRGARGHVRDDRPGIPIPIPTSSAEFAKPSPSPPIPGQPTVAAETTCSTCGDAASPGTSGQPMALDGEPARRQTKEAARPPAGATAPGAGKPAAKPAARDGAQDPPPAGGQEAARPVHISVLGPLRITAAGTEIQGGLRKARELLAYLAVHPEGATGGAISRALWPGASPRHATAQRNLALRKAREMLRTATGLAGPMFIVLSGERYQLDPQLIDVDLWRFRAALAGARAAATEQDQLAALRRATALYHGTLADGGYDWAERDAEPARRQALDAQARIAALLASRHPEQALAALEAALTHDRYNEAIYQQIMDLHARLGRPDAARRTLRLLETRLAELGQPPSRAGHQRAESLPGNQPSRSPRSRRG